MGFKVILTPQSLNDLEEIVRFIAKDNPERARSFAHELINRALSLETFPERGRMMRSVKFFRLIAWRWRRKLGFQPKLESCE